MGEQKMLAVDHPGEVIREELEARGWSQRDLAFVLGIKEQQVSQLLSGARHVTPELARMLGDAFDVSPDFFANLQKQWELSRAKAPDPAVKVRASLLAKWPVREMIFRRWIEDADPELLTEQISRFFELDNENAEPEVAFAAKRTNYDDDPPGQVAWLFRVRQLARQVQVPPYSRDRLLQAVERMRPLLIEPEAAQQVAPILAECGVRLVVVEALPNIKIDGVCTWLDDHSPVIGLSTFYDRFDNFWFVLRHEIEHVLNGDGREKGILDTLEGEAATDSDKLPAEERRANSAAANFCVPREKMMSFYARKAPYFSERDVVGFASVMEVHPALVVGQIQFLTGRYNYLRKYQVPVRRYVVADAVTDGWGHVAPAVL
jgi:HTH-type transcriptional regulator/antitoxin HigA